MRLLMLHPGIAHLDCDFCLKHMVDEKTGVPEIGRGGVPELRILNMSPEYLSPCRDLRRDGNGRRVRTCPKGTPENPKTLSPENELCYEHFLECKAIGQFPDDSVVRRNAAVIQGVLDAVSTIQENEYRNRMLRALE